MDLNNVGGGACCHTEVSHQGEKNMYHPSKHKQSLGDSDASI